MLNDVSKLLFGDSGAGDIQDIMNQNKRLYEGINLPELEFNEYTPEALLNESMKAELVNEDPLIKQAQMKALERMAGLAETGFSDVDQANLMGARDQADSMVRQNRDAVLQNAQARGVAGGGLEFALKEMANQEASERARKSGMEGAAETARMRAMQQQAYQNALSGQRSQDFQANAKNTDILNQFNQMNTQNRNATNQYNVANRNTAQTYNNEQKNTVAQNQFNNEMARAGGISGANQGVATAVASGQAANASNTNALINAGAGMAGAYLGRK
jgi:hypothetical protein